MLWGLSVCFLAFAVRVGVANAGFWRDIHRWEREASVTGSLDLADPIGRATVGWHQDCDAVCKQGLWMRPDANTRPQALAGLSGSLVVEARESEYHDQRRWSIDDQATPGAEGLTRVLSVDPPPNGPAELRITLDRPLPEGAAGVIEFQLRPELCGIEQMGATVESVIAAGSGLAGVLLGVALAATRARCVR